MVCEKLRDEHLGTMGSATKEEASGKAVGSEHTILSRYKYLKPMNLELSSCG